VCVFILMLMYPQWSNVQANCLLRNWNTSHYDNRQQMLCSF